MNRREFLVATAVGASTICIAGTGSLAQSEDKIIPAKTSHGACGISCAGCRMQLNGNCDGCGKGPRAECEIFQCSQKKNLDFCAKCKGYPCAKIKEKGKFSDKWLEKMSKAPVPA